ncbi:hypothetical protein F2P79_020779 [Pimephales promelas]|nr:hypothetical protein F2P79_020779 [Pimephales promelas]
MVESDRYRWTKSLHNLPEVTNDDVVRMVGKRNPIKSRIEGFVIFTLGATDSRLLSLSDLASKLPLVLAALEWSLATPSGKMPPPPLPSPPCFHRTANPSRVSKRKLHGDTPRKTRIIKRTQGLAALGRTKLEGSIMSRREGETNGSSHRTFPRRDVTVFTSLQKRAVKLNRLRSSWKDKDG